MRLCSCNQPHVKAAVGTRTIAPAPTPAQTVVGQPTPGALSLTRLPAGSHALVTKLPHGKNYISNRVIKRMVVTSINFVQVLKTADFRSPPKKKTPPLTHLYDFYDILKV